MLASIQKSRRFNSRGCEHCRFTGSVFSTTLQADVKCPHCNRRPRQDKTVREGLTAAEAKRTQQFLQRAALVTVAEELLQIAMPRDLLTTDRILQRWAVSMGSGLPFDDDDLDQLAKEAAQESDLFTAEQAKPPALDDSTQTVVDQIIGPDPERGTSTALLNADPQARSYRRLREARRAVTLAVSGFVWQWYCKPVPCTIMSAQRQTDGRGLQTLWHGTLREMRGHFLGSGHQDLVALVRMLA